MSLQKLDSIVQKDSLNSIGEDKEEEENSLQTFGIAMIIV